MMESSPLTVVDVLKEISKAFLLLLLWVILIFILIVTLPFLAVAFILRTTEATIYRFKYNVEKLPSQDVLYTMTKPENRMFIAGFLQVNGEMHINQLRMLIQQNLINRVDENQKKLYPKATQHIHPGYINYYWKEDACFDIENHVYALTDSPIASEHELKTLIGDHCSKPLQDELQRSPWEFVLIPYINSNGIHKSVVLFKLAHAIGDGSALAYFLLNFLADHNDNTASGSIVKKFSEIDRKLLTIKGLLQLPLAYLRLALMATDTNTLHSFQLTGNKHVTWSKPIDLKKIKNVKNNLHTTVNDVLVGNFAKTMHDYFEKHQFNKCTTATAKINKKFRQTFSAVIPVDTRTSIAEAEHFENHVAGVVVPISTAPNDVLTSIKDTKKTLDDMKHLAVPLSMDLGWRYFSFLLPAFLARIFVYNMLDKTTAIISNIIGPQYEISIDGHTVDFLTFWPPQTNNETVGVSFCSYDGNVTVGLQVDSAVMLDPHEIVTMYEDNLHQLVNTISGA